MPSVLTEEEFSKHLNTEFQVRPDPDTTVNLQLENVKGYSSQHVEHEGMERFSAFFVGPEQPFLQQMSYPMEHEQMGEFELLLVPVGRVAGGFRYEAVFNSFKISGQ